VKLKLPKGVSTTKEEASKLQDTEYYELLDIMKVLTKGGAAVKVKIIPELIDKHFSYTFPPPRDWMSESEQDEYSRTGKWPVIFYNEYAVYFNTYDSRAISYGALRLYEMEYLVSKLKEFAQKYNKRISFNFRSNFPFEIRSNAPDMDIYQGWSE
jgi:hypothetical protein